MKTIIFLSGLAVSKSLAKSSLVWNDSLWKDYNRIYYTSLLPTSDQMVINELKNLSNLYFKHPDAYFVGHSLGAWWLANLVNEPYIDIRKMVLMTPLVDTKYYPIFNVTEKFNPIFRGKKLYGLDKVCILPANKDLVVSPRHHADLLIQYLNAIVYVLDGGHLYQHNHLLGLEFMKYWLNRI